VKSVRTRLTLLLLGASAAAWLLAAGAVYLRGIDEVNELFDFQLRGVALAASGETLPEISHDRVIDDGVVVQVWRNGHLIYHTGSDIAPQPPPEDGSLLDLSGPDDDWRSFSHHVGDRIVQAAQPLSARRAIAAQYVLRMLLPLLFLLIPLALLIGWIVGRQLAPLQRLARLLEHRQPHDLAPIPLGPAPSEIATVLKALNELLARLRASVEEQRAFLADAAHELRTPLAVVRLQAQAVERSHTADERIEALKALQRGVDRATHLSRQLLTLARLEPGAALPIHRQRLPLDTALREAIAERLPHATISGLDLQLLEATALTLEGDRGEVDTLIGNLLDNALRYTPPGGRITAALCAAGSQARLDIIDSGPGIPPAERERVFDRFQRGLGAAGGGSGLGLAIVQRIVARLHGQIELGDAMGGGLHVRIHLPATDMHGTPDRRHARLAGTDRMPEPDPARSVGSAG
jgi:Signal transduction histidine kinase